MEMTSIEALNKIEHTTNVTKETSWETTVNNPYFQEIKTIKEDLEVLRILKERLASVNVTQDLLRRSGKDKTPSITVSMNIELTKKAYKKVKEWIER